MAEGDGNFSKKIEIDTFKYVLNMSFRKIKATVVKKTSSNCSHCESAMSV